MSLMWSRRRQRHEQLTARPRRVVIGATGARIAEMSITPPDGKGEFITRHSLQIGVPLAWIQIGFINGYLSGTGLPLSPPTSMSFVGAKVKGATWSGVVDWLDAIPTPSPTIAPGAELRTARLYPRDLGWPTFQPGQVVWLDLIGAVPNGGRLPLGPIYTFNGGVGATGFFAMYSTPNRIDQLGTEGDMVAPTGAVLGSAYGAAGFDGDTPGPSVPANNMCVGASYVIGEVI